MAELIRAGFEDRGGRGSHRNLLHPAGVRVTLSGRPGDDAKRYQEQEVAQRIAVARAARGVRR
jgi:predicted RNA binding protein YcfA (HicA-like mRNA interferase family)